MNYLLLIVVFAVVLALSFAALNFYLVKKMKEGTEKMQEIAAAIREFDEMGAIVTALSETEEETEIEEENYEKETGTVSPGGQLE